MSVKVDLKQLADTLTDYTFAYLVTVDDNYHAHTVACDPRLVDGVIDVGPIGDRTRRNLALHDNVTLIWPPRSPSGFSLIVDGHAGAGATGDDAPQITPTRAVLHRKRSNGPTAASIDDCVVLSEN
ncbi:pyridoxamine 5'-phosphate oxidase family protein [Mycolicibacterium goodii]|uniref:pyridoxamine 5'-phosphate oxidase family protein n=1 Tax=Mycolicibacterium goodii TaxID=134601 RepID=UPI001BDD25EF|nr:pyridoxamine 5'-phosphate oxidase family protein [Mycolicibacterium goodii]MBU8808548.1 pyridoxamine 5'-phosphate oxidase family protein [Mycolicibacterium goodii]